MLILTQAHLLPFLRDKSANSCHIDSNKVLDLSYRLSNDAVQKISTTE